MSALTRCLRTAAIVTIMVWPYSAMSASPQIDGPPNVIAAPTAILTQTLHNTGVTKPVLLPETGSSQEFFLPVPRNVEIADGRVSFHARYLSGRREGGMLQVLVDGQPIYAGAHDGNGGDLNLQIPLPPREYPSGFVRLGVNWLSDETVRACEIAPPSVNSLTILPSTGIEYRVPSVGSIDLVTAWHLVPADARLTIAGSNVGSEVFDAAWRVGTALERAGKSVQIHPMPAAGSRIALGEFDIPTSIAGNPVIAELRGQASVTLSSEAQLGALLLLDSEAILGDAVIVDTGLVEKITSATKAFADTLSTPVQREWYEATLKATGLQLRADQAGPDIFIIGNRPSRILAIRDGAGSQASAAFTQLWRNTLLTSSASVRQARGTALLPSGALRLSSLRGSTRSMDVMNHATWQTNFSYGTVDFKGLVPSKLVLDVAASPDTSGARPVISVTWNDILLTATRLQADGESERISARIPAYAIGQSNSIKVALQRLPSASNCTEPQVGFPFNVLPSSHITTKEAHGEPTFLGVMPLIANKADLVVPESWLQRAPFHLTQVIRLATASGLSAESATLRLQQAGEVYQPAGSFVAMAVAVANAKPRTTITNDGRMLVSGDKAALFDVDGLHAVASVEVLRVAEHLGLYWIQAAPEDLKGASATHLAPYNLDRGDVAIVTSTGVAKWLDSSDLGQGGLTERANSAFYEWRRLFSWGVPTILGLLFLVLILLAMAYRAGRRNVQK